MITAKFANSVNATEIMLDRQTALDKVLQEANATLYAPATQVPLCQSEHNTWLAYWQPIWAEQAVTEQVSAGWSHYGLGLAIETCSPGHMRRGWRQARASHNTDTWRTIAADAKPGLDVADSLCDWWIVNDDTNCEVHILGESDQYQPAEDDLFWLDDEVTVYNAYGDAVQGI